MSSHKPTPKPFTPLLPSQPTHPRSRFFGPGGTHHILRDQLTLPTWLALGALAQTTLFLLPIPTCLACLPAATYLFLTSLDAYAQATGWRRNTYMADIIPQKVTAVVPDTHTGEYGSTPANAGVVVLLIGTRSNHPLGMLAPGFAKSGEYFTQMATDLDAHAQEFGYLGMSTYLNINDRATKGEVMNVAYFRTTEGLHRFAHSEFHLQAWRWWNANVRRHPHLSIYHEIFDASRGNWESIYINSNPTGLGAGSAREVDEESGVEGWGSTVVDASRGVLKTSAGRMGRSLAAREHEAVEGHDVYEKV